MNSPHLKLDFITVKGFKSIASIEKLPLAPINILIGPNGSGKSNFIGVFTFLHAIREGRLQDYVAKAGGADHILHFGSKTTKAIEIHISFDNGVNGYEIELETTSTDELIPVLETVYFKGQGYKKPYQESLSRKGGEAGISDERLTRIPGFVRDHLGSWRLYHFQDTSVTSPMKKNADLNDNRYLRPDGSNLSAFLYFLKSKHKDSYELIRKTIRQVTPFFDDFQLEPSKLNSEKNRLEWKHVNSEKYFDASSLSDGTLRFMALATLFLQPEKYRPSVILVDEPELGLHPFAVTILASLIQHVSSKTQVIVSAQSPFLLDQFSPEDVLVANRKMGATQISRLSTESLKTWLEDYSLGQLWEKNEIGGRPTRDDQ